jgi:hypothetical protein
MFSEEKKDICKRVGLGYSPTFFQLLYNIIPCFQGRVPCDIKQRYIHGTTPSQLSFDFLQLAMPSPYASIQPVYIASLPNANPPEMTMSRVPQTRSPPAMSDFFSRLNNARNATVAPTPVFATTQE